MLLIFMENKKRRAQQQQLFIMRRRERQSGKKERKKNERWIKKSDQIDMRELDHFFLCCLRGRIRIFYFLFSFSKNIIKNVHFNNATRCAHSFRWCAISRKFGRNSSLFIVSSDFRRAALLRIAVYSLGENDLYVCLGIEHFTEIQLWNLRPDRQCLVKDSTRLSCV